MPTESHPPIGRPEACPDIYIVIRRTLEWRDDEAVRAELKPELRSKCETWNRAFGMPYNQFRQRLKEIAQGNLDRVTDCAIAPIEAVPPGAMVARVDDDDWFAPDLATRIRAAHDPTVKGYHWTPYVLEPQRVRRRWPWDFLGLGGPPPGAGPITFTCETNHYAVVHADGWVERTKKHSEASRLFDERPSDVRRVPSMLSLQNKSLASQSVLNWGKPTVDPDMLRRRFRRYRKFYRRTELPSPLAWAAPYVEMMAELMDDLRLA